MQKTFKANLRFHFQDIFAALQKLGEESGKYRLISTVGHTITLEMGGFTAKEWATSTKATLEPTRTFVVDVTPNQFKQTTLTIEVTRHGIF